MIVVDTSAWIEFLRGTGSPAHHALVAAVTDGVPLGVPSPVLMELLAGARPERRNAVRRMLAHGTALPTAAPYDYETAADLYQACRAAGETPRSLVDCLVAAVALRHDAPVLHADRDYDVLTRHTPLTVRW